MIKQKTLLRIKELEEATGLNRRTIHYYMAEGLLSLPLRTGKTMAYYNSKHIEEIKNIEKLRKEGYPISLIKQGLDGKNHIAVDASVKSNRSQKKINLITEKAVEIFAKVGFRQAQMSAIAKAAGVVRGTIYLYFPNKKTLFMECLKKVYYEVFKDANEELWQEKQPLKRLVKRVEMVFKSHPQFIDIMQEINNCYDDTPEMRTQRKEIYDLILFPIKKDLGRAINEHLIPPMDVTAVSYMFLDFAATAQIYLNYEKDASIEKFISSLTMLLSHKSSS